MKVTGAAASVLVIILAVTAAGCDFFKSSGPEGGVSPFIKDLRLSRSAVGCDQNFVISFGYDDPQNDIEFLRVTFQHEGGSTFQEEVLWVGGGCSSEIDPQGDLQVTPVEGLCASGPRRGPFTPPSIQYTLRNDGQGSLNWTATKSRDWVTVSPTEGSLSRSGTDTVTVSINSRANSLPTGFHGDTVFFTNTTDGSGNTERFVSLEVGVGTRLDLTVPERASYTTSFQCDTGKPTGSYNVTIQLVDERGHESNTRSETIGLTSN